MESANDAAVTIAQGVSGSRPQFVEDMNDRARALRLADTSYANPIGLDDPLNYSSARDLATLARRLMRDERFADVVRRPEAVLESGARRRVVSNRNDLIGRVPRVDGVKTGYTRQAGYVLVGSAAGVGGARVVSVVLGEPSESARDADVEGPAGATGSTSFAASRRSTPAARWPRRTSPTGTGASGSCPPGRSE